MRYIHNCITAFSRIVLKNFLLPFNKEVLMSKNITFGFIVIMARLLVGEAVGCQSRQRTPEQLKRQEDFQKKHAMALYKAEIVDATPVQIGVLTDQQRKHSKLHSSHGRTIKK